MGKILEKVFSRKPKQLDLETYLLKLKERGLSIDGREVPDPVPIAPPIGYKKQPSMVEIVRDMVRGERLRLAAIESGKETFEESEDFDVGDEPEELRSPYENDFDPPLRDIAKAVDEAKASEREKAAAGGPAPKPGDAAPPPPAPPPAPSK